MRMANRLVAAAMVAAWTLRATGAFAQQPAPGAQVPPVTPAPTPPANVGTQPPTAADAQIAAPGPGADPAKVEKAKEVAQAAKVTPIATDPNNPTRPAFQLYAELDLPVLGIGAVFAAARLIRTQRAFCAPLCDPNDLNALDRTTAGFYSTGWSSASDYALYAGMLGAAVILVADEGVRDALNDAVVIAESALSSTAVSSMLTLAAGRPRPLLFGTNAPLDQRDSADASLSFLSSHASVSFAVATSTYMASRRLHPKSKYPLLVLGMGGALAAFVGTARIEAGKHFISVSVGGALVGSALGVLIPALHTSPVKVVPVISERERGMGFQGVF